MTVQRASVSLVAQRSSVGSWLLRSLARVPLYVFLSVLAVAFLFPFYTMVVGSLMAR